MRGTEEKFIKNQRKLVESEKRERMAAPYKTVDKIIAIIKNHVPKENIPHLLADLAQTLTESKNQSYNETISRIIRRFSE